MCTCVCTFVYACTNILIHAYGPYTEVVKRMFVQFYTCRIIVSVHIQFSSGMLFACVQALDGPEASAVLSTLRDLTPSSALDEIQPTIGLLTDTIQANIPVLNLSTLLATLRALQELKFTPSKTIHDLVHAVLLHPVHSFSDASLAELLQTLVQLRSRVHIPPPPSPPLLRSINAIDTDQSTEQQLVAESSTEEAKGDYEGEFVRGTHTSGRGAIGSASLDTRFTGGDGVQSSMTVPPGSWESTDWWRVHAGHGVVGGPVTSAAMLGVDDETALEGESEDIGAARAVLQVLRLAAFEGEVPAGSKTSNVRPAPSYTLSTTCARSFHPKRIMFPL